MSKNNAIMVKLKDGRLGIVPCKQPKGLPEGKVSVELCDTALIGLYKVAKVDTKNDLSIWSGQGQ